MSLIQKSLCFTESLSRHHIVRLGRGLFYCVRGSVSSRVLRAHRRPPRRSYSHGTFSPVTPCYTFRPGSSFMHGHRHPPCKGYLPSCFQSALGSHSYCARAQSNNHAPLCTRVSDAAYQCGLENRCGKVRCGNVGGRSGAATTPRRSDS